MISISGTGGIAPIQTPASQTEVTAVQKAVPVNAGSEDPPPAQIHTDAKPVSAVQETDAASNSLLIRPAIPLPIEDYLPGPKSEAELAEAELINSGEKRAEQLREGVSATASQPPKGEALNMLIPMPDGTEARAQPESVEA